MSYDIWQTEREAAEVVAPSGVRVLRRESAAGAPLVLIWRPKATKPDANFRFRSAQQREEYIQQWVGRFAQAEALKAERKAEQAAVASAAEPVMSGTLFAHSWGWEQTNVDFYEVVKASATMVEIRPIASEEVSGTQGFMCATVKPVPGAFIEKSYRLQDAHGNYRQSLRKRVQYTDRGEPYLSFEYGWCGLTTADEGHYSSWYA